MNQTDETIRTIRQTNHFVKSILEAGTNDIENFWLGGEITYYHKSDRNHAYFTLEDEGFSIRCMIWSRDLENIEFPLSKGIIVDVFGNITVYDKRAEVQVQVEQMRLVDKQTAEFDTDIIQRLKDVGLWPRQKRDLPEVVNRIALITSKNSAAVEDFRNTYYQQGGTGSIEIIDVLLQGENAPQSIVEAIHRANQLKDIDVIVLSRGGGRHIDLSVFNDYTIAKAICQSNIPTVTGIGHQQDDTIADHVADQSTSTPTAAAFEVAKLRPPTESISAQATGNTLQPSNPQIWKGIIIVIGLVIIALLVFLILQSF